MAVDLNILVGRQIEVRNTLGLNILPPGVTNITVDATDVANKLIQGHFGNDLFIVHYNDLGYFHVIS